MTTTELTKLDRLQSPYGWHPCDYETFRKLKAVHAVFVKERAKFYQMCRDLRKAPRNRTGFSMPSPAFCLFREEGDKTTDSWGGTWHLKYLSGRMSSEFRPSPKYPYGRTKRLPQKLHEHNLPTLYSQARHPLPHRVAEFTRGQLETINSLYSLLFDCPQE